VSSLGSLPGLGWARLSYERRLAVHWSSTRAINCVPPGDHVRLAKEGNHPQRPLPRGSAAGVFGGFPRRKSQRKLRSASIPSHPPLPRSCRQTSPQLRRASITSGERGGAGRGAAGPSRSAGEGLERGEQQPPPPD
jgi:hypothetical protein